MKLRDRLVELARENLNALLEKAAERTDPRRRLADFSDEALEAELARRREGREGEERVAEARTAEANVTEARNTVDAPPQDAQPTGGLGGSMPADRAERERMARERAQKVKAAREARTRAAERAHEGRTAGPRQGPRPGPAPGHSTGHAGPGPRPGAARQTAADPSLARWYAVLEVPCGADFEMVRSAYRRLMRKYHPDLHNQTPEKLKAANEVARALTEAYSALEKALGRSSSRR